MEVKPFSDASLPGCLAEPVGNGYYCFTQAVSSLITPSGFSCGTWWSPGPMGQPLGCQFSPTCPYELSESQGSTYLDRRDICASLLSEAFLIQLLQRGQGFLLLSVPLLFLQPHSREQTGKWCRVAALHRYQTLSASHRQPRSRAENQRDWRSERCLQHPTLGPQLMGNRPISCGHCGLGDCNCDTQEGPQFSV